MSIMFSVLEIVDNVQVLTLACLRVHGSQNSTGIAALYRDTKPLQKELGGSSLAVTAVMRLPSSCTKSDASSPSAPNVSTAIGTKW